MAAAVDLKALLAQLGSRIATAKEAPSPVLPLGWAELDDALPDRGLPRGVVELAAPHALGGATSIALSAVRAAHARDPRAWCAWLDPEATLHAPGLARAGVDLGRLLVVRPPRAELARFAVKVASSRGFDVVVVDFDHVPHARAVEAEPAGKKRRRMAPEVLVRKLALAAEEGGATILLLTDARAPRAAAWPVALRLELARTSPGTIEVRVAKDRRGRVGVKKTVPLTSRPTRFGETG